MIADIFCIERGIDCRVSLDAVARDSSVSETLEIVRAGARELIRMHGEQQEFKRLLRQERARIRKGVAL